MRVNEGQGLLNANPGLSGESQCMIDHFTYVDGVWNGLTVHMDFIITKAASNVHPIALMNVDYGCSFLGERGLKFIGFCLGGLMV